MPHFFALLKEKRKIFMDLVPNWVNAHTAGHPRSGTLNVSRKFWNMWLHIFFSTNLLIPCLSSAASAFALLHLVSFTFERARDLEALARSTIKNLVVQIFDVLLTCQLRRKRRVLHVQMFQSYAPFAHRHPVLCGSTI